MIAINNAADSRLIGWLKRLQVMRSLYAPCAAFLICALLALLVPPVQAASDNATVSETSANRQEIVTLVAEDGVRVSAILMNPNTGLNPHSPAIVFHHGGFGGHPARPIGAPRFAAERLSAMGYTTLSLLSRQSSGHLRSNFEESQKDIRAAIDFLATRGISDIVLAGHSLGSIRIAGYLADNDDSRVKAAIHLAPTADMPDTLQQSWGQERYDREVARAQKAVANGRGTLDVSLDPDRTKGLTPDPFIDFGYTLQFAEAFLSWWGPDARTRLSERVAEFAIPTLMLAGSEDAYVPAGRMERLKAASQNPDLVTHITYDGGDHFFTGFQDQSSADIAYWLAQQGLSVRPAITTRIVDVELDNGRAYPGILYTPQSGIDPAKPVFIVQHGYTGTIASSSNNWLSQRLAQAGYVALAPMTRSSGLTGIVSGKMDNMVADFGDWVDFLEAHGHSNIITVGHSLGGIWTALYAAETQDPRIKAMVYMAPTRSLPGHAQEDIGNAVYRELSERAQRLVDSGEGNTILADKYYRSPPAVDGSRSIFFQQAESWLDYWGPESKAVLTRQLARIDRPMLSLAGSKDLYVDWAYMEEVRDASAGDMDLVWYDGVDGANHGFTGYEDRVVADIVTWVEERKLNSADDPDGCLQH